MPGDILSHARADLFTRGLQLDPHIYHRFSGWKLALNINPRGITTSTAFTLFRPSSGANVFTGFGRIHSVDMETGTMVATALAIGVPLPAFALSGHFSSARPIQPVTPEPDLKILEDAVTRSRCGRWYGDVPNCDFCGRSFEGETYIIDGPMQRGGPWGIMCTTCYSIGQLPLCVGRGQLYRWEAKLAVSSVAIPNAARHESRCAGCAIGL